MIVAMTSAAAADQVSGTLISPNGPSLRDNHPPPGAPAPRQPERLNRFHGEFGSLNDV